MDDEIITLLSNSYDSPNETRKSSIILLFQYMEADLDCFLKSIINILQNNPETRIKFLSLSLIRYIYQYYDQVQIDILTQVSEILIESCISLLQSEIAVQSGATLAEISIFLSTFDMNIDQIVHSLIQNLEQNTIEAGSFEFFNTVCDEINIDSSLYFTIINFITNPEFLSQANQIDVIKGIQLISHIILRDIILIELDTLTSIVNFLISAISTFEYKSSVYICFAYLVKKSSYFQHITLDQFFFEELLNDLENENCVFEICYFLRRSIKSNYLITPSNSSSFFFRIFYLYCIQYLYLTENMMLKWD